MNKLLPLALLLPLLASPVLLPSQAHGQPAASKAGTARIRDSLRGPAREAYERAMALFQARNFDAARVEFLQAHSLGRDPRVLYNVAVCDKELRRYARALEALRRSLAEGGPSLPRSYVRTAESTIRTLEPFVTTLDVRSSLPGATLYVGEDAVGTTPLPEPIAIDVGEHVIRLEKPGYRHEPVKVRASGGEPAVVDITLLPVVRTTSLDVRVRGLPSDRTAEVFVDGVPVGTAPWTGQVESGRRRIEVRAPGFRSVQRVEVLTVDQERRLSFDLSQSRERARLRVITDDPDNRILLDGKLLARGSYDGNAPTGERSLSVQRDGAKPYSTELVLRDRETRTVDVRLESTGGIPAWVWVTGGVVLAGAATATVLLNNKETQYDGQSAGTLPPRIVPASYSIGGR